MICLYHRCKQVIHCLTLTPSIGFWYISCNGLKKKKKRMKNVDMNQGMGSPSHGCLLKVGRLVDAYLAEIAPDPYLSLPKFIAMIEVLPDYGRVIDDGLYRAIDIYLKLRLKNALSGSCGDGLLSQKMSSGVASAAMSPRDTYACLRRENRELKLEISRMRVRLSDLEKEQVVMKQGMMDKSSGGKTLITSISRGFGKMGNIQRARGGERETTQEAPSKRGEEWEKQERFCILIIRLTCM
ncbi:UNVERIFIED_CONTAM: BTB/POZ domain-containing protein [Sesamum angustifolium]|uniref:BTB/POZ domain-containing protein n=1 Tax=Sesamum angustifolium TaxID=2727405 RepID=A0AAW2IJP9_9LAMI